MSTTAVRSPAEFEQQLQRYLYERSEEGRAVRVGEKEVSEQAAIVARYADLFSRDQLQTLRAEEKRISLRELEAVLRAASEQIETAFLELRETWFERLLGPERESQPSSAHMGYVRRLSPLDATYTKDRATDVCLETLSALGFDLAADRNIRLDLDDRPQKSPRACVIASDPPRVVHLITRAQGGLHDYQAFLHEAGHALHYGGIGGDLPYAFRRISRDHALTEIYSYIIEAISREPEWHARYFELSDAQAAENAEATVFLEALLYRRYEAKLRYELDYWSRFAGDGGDPDVYERLLTDATGVRYRRGA